MNDSTDPDSWREELLRDADRYREQWSVWKGAYYAGVLTVCGIFLAIAPLLPREHWFMSHIVRLLMTSALIACVCVIWNMRLFIQLYDLLGFAKIPKDAGKMSAYFDKQCEILTEFAKKESERKTRDRAILVMMVISVSSLVVALFL